MNKPKIRFKGFEGEWKERKIGDALSINSGRDYKHLEEGDIPVYGTGGYMLSVNERISDCDAIGIGRKGTIDKPQYLRAPFWTVDTLFFLIAKVGIDLDFAYNLSQVIGWRKYDESTGVPSLSKNNIEKIPISLPSLPEQRALASYFTALDAQIAASTSRLSSLKQIKAASLLNMFPQKGETVPRVRFKGFQGEWKKVKIGDVAPLTGGFAFQSGQFKTSGVPIIRISNILSSGIVGGDFVYYNEFKGDSEFRLYKGDVVIAMSGATTGKVATFEANDFGYQNQRVGKFSRTNLVNYELLSKLVSAPNFQKKIISKLTSSAQPNASSKDIDSIDLVVPEETEEQRAIASYFTTLDAQITLHRKRLEKLKQIKAACLEKMFA